MCAAETRRIEDTWCSPARQLKSRPERIPAIDNRVTRGRVFEKQEGNTLLSRAAKQRSTSPGAEHSY